MQLNVDFSQIPQFAGSEPIPADWYFGKIVETEQVPTKDSATTGHFMLKLVTEIIEGPFIGRKIFDQLNIGHSNPAVQEIAYKQLSSVAHSVGVIQVADSDQLCNIPLKIRVKLKPARTDTSTGQEYEARNEVGGYKNVKDNSANVGGGKSAGVVNGAPVGFAQPAQPVQVAPTQPAQATPQGFQPPQQQQFQQPQQAAAATPAFAPVQAQSAPAQQAFAPQQGFNQPTAQPQAAAEQPATQPAAAGAAPPWAAKA